MGDFVERCIRDRVALICVVGDDCERVHDIIDELIVGDGSVGRNDSPVTTWHDNETLADVRDFAHAWSIEGAASATAEEVRLVF